MNDTMPVQSLCIGEYFVYDNETFVKTAEDDGTTIAWSVHRGKQYKEWAFKKGTPVVKLNEKK